MENIRLAILGCGAITRLEHLPAAIAHPNVRLVALVDSDLERTRILARSRGLDCLITDNTRSLAGQVDAVINALPNHLHGPATLEALRAGQHVLCEKPLAITAASARECAASAEQNKLVLAVGMNRRFTASHSLLHLVLRDGILGSVQDYDCQYGGAFDWKSASGFYFSRAHAGGGALIDYGIHLLDALVDWFGPVSHYDYQDDNWGSGVEANAILALKHSGKHGEITSRVQVSRTFGLKNRLLVRGSDAQAEINADDLDAVVIHRDVCGTLVKEKLYLPDWPATSSFYKQLDDFVQSIRDQRQPQVNGGQAVYILELIEKCYANPKRIPEPWSDVPVAVREARA